ncbi:molybdenum cofactor biosynthesis protein F, partial [Burkholderia pseudomallei]
FLVALTFKSPPAAARTLVFNTATRRARVILSRIRSRDEAGAAPRVAQDFNVGTIARGQADASVSGILGISGSEPAETR